MIVEHELLEQIAENSWTLERCVAFVGPDKDPWLVLKGLYGDGCLEFRHADTGLLAGWRVRRILESHDVSEGTDILETATLQGVKRAYE